MRALELGERSALERRASELRDALSGYSDSEVTLVKAQISAMLGGFRSMRQQGDDVEGIVAATAAVLRDFPLWAISKACLAIARNETGLDPRFPPNDTEIYAAVTKIVQFHRHILRDVEGILDAAVRPALPALPSPLKNDAEPRGADPFNNNATAKKPMDGKHAQRVAADLAARKSQSAAA